MMSLVVFVALGVAILVVNPVSATSVSSELSNTDWFLEKLGDSTLGAPLGAPLAAILAPFFQGFAKLFYMFKF